MNTETETQKIQPNIKSLLIEGRLWFDKVNGNTYHAVRIQANGRIIHQIPLTYGYENAYEYTALKWLQSFGLVSDEVKSIYELRQCAEIYSLSYYTKKSELWKAENINDNFSKLLFIEELKGRNKY